MVLCIMLFISLLEFSIPQLTQFTIDKIIPEKRYDSLIWIGAGILCAAILLAILNYFNSYIVSKVGQKAIMDIRNSMYEHIQTLDMKFFDKNRTGDLMSRLTNDVNLLQQLISSSMLQVLTDTVTFIAVAVYMLFINWKLTRCPSYYIPFHVLYHKGISGNASGCHLGLCKVPQEMSATSYRIRFQECGSFNLFTNEEFESRRFAERNQENMTANLKSVRLRSMFGPIIDLLNNIGLVAVIVFRCLASDGR
ncbi:ABC transporter ATP-binding protein [Peribacillus frigoritolerans]|nr:ABC transporter ATP-binding protein [Peribacillus frigoritolerans]